MDPIVKALPATVEPITKPSLVIEKLTNKRKHNHDTYLKDMRRQFRDINAKIQEEITGECHKFLASDQEIAEVDQLHQVLIQIEHRRSDQLRQVFKDAYDKLHANSHQSVAEIDMLIEAEMHKFNQITLNNYLVYCQLVQSLKEQTQERARVVAIEQMSDAIVEDAPPPPITICEIEDEAEEEQPGEDPEEDLERWAEKVQAKLESIEWTARKLLDSYKVAVKNVFGRYFVELDALAASVQPETPVPVQDAVVVATTTNNEIYKPLFDELTTAYNIQIGELKKLWEQQVETLQEDIDKTCDFLIASSALWSEHFCRAEEAQNLTLREIRLTTEKGDKTLREMDAKLSIEIDKLRQESTPAKLAKQLVKVNKKFDALGKQLEATHLGEMKIFQKYTTQILERDIEILLAEIRRFLNDNPPPKEHDPRVFRERESQMSVVEEPISEQVIPYQMKTARCQMYAIKNWMFGLWEAINQYLNTCKDEMKLEGETWARKYESKLIDRFQIKVTTLKTRYKRLKATVYEPRLAEILGHAHRFEQIENYTPHEAILRSRNDETRSLIESLIGDLVATIAGRNDDHYDLRKRSLEIDADLLGLDALCQEFEHEIVALIIDNQTLIDDLSLERKLAINDFHRSIVVFADGDFSNAEATMYDKKVGNLVRNLSKKYQPFVDDLVMVKDEMVTKLNRIKNESVIKLKQIRDELQFHEFTLGEIKRLRHEIKRMVYDLKFRFKRTEAFTDFLHDSFRVDLERLRLDRGTLERNYDEAIEQVTSFVDYLLVPPAGSTMSLDTSAHYLPVLFDTIQRSLKSLKEGGSKFYQHISTNLRIYKNDILHDNYEQFVEEIEPVYKNFKLQCEISWLECLEDLITTLLKILNFVNHYHEEIIREHLSDSRGHFRSFCTARLKVIYSKVRRFGHDYLAIDTSKSSGDLTKTVEDQFASIKHRHIDDFNSEIKRCDQELKGQLETIEHRCLDIHEFMLDKIGPKNDLLTQILQTSIEQFQTKSHVVTNILLCRTSEDASSATATTRPSSLDVNLSQDSTLNRDLDTSLTKISMFRLFLDNLSLTEQVDQSVVPNLLSQMINESMKKLHRVHRETLEEIKELSVQIHRTHQEFVDLLHSGADRSRNKLSDRHNNSTRSIISRSADTHLDD